MHRINLYTRDPTQGLLAAMVRKAAKRDLGTTPTNLKEPWTVSDVRLVCTRFCHLMVEPPQFETTLLAAPSFFTASSVDDLVRLRWDNLETGTPGVLVVRFDKRKGDQFREGLATVLPDAEDTCPNVPGLLRLWRAIDKPPEKTSYIFPAFSFAAAKRGEGQLAFASPVGADTYRKALA